MVVDKTGTLTHGTARLVSVQTLAALDEAEILRLAASLDQASGHPVARALVEEARRRGMPLAQPTMVTESPGDGVTAWWKGDTFSSGGPA